MTQKNAGLFFRPFAVSQMRSGGVNLKIEATEMECATIAVDFKLAGIKSLVSEFRLTGSSKRVKAVGKIKADIQQICVVSLDTFETILEEDIELVFVEKEGKRRQPELPESEDDGPDPIINGQIDLGAVTLEFLALGLDPYPRKPGVSFEDVQKIINEKNGPFAALGEFASDKPEGGS